MSNLRAGIVASLVIAASVWMAGCDQLKSVVASSDPISECFDSRIFADKKVCVQVHYEDKVKSEPKVDAPAVK